MTVLSPRFPVPKGRAKWPKNGRHSLRFPLNLATIQLEEKLKLMERTDVLLTALPHPAWQSRRHDLVTVKARELVDELIEAARQDKDEDK